MSHEALVSTVGPACTILSHTLTQQHVRVFENEQCCILETKPCLRDAGGVAALEQSDGRQRAGVIQRRHARVGARAQHARPVRVVRQAGDDACGIVLTVCHLCQ